MADKRTTIADAVAELSRRHDHRVRRLGLPPQADGVVREILRTDLAT